VPLPRRGDPPARIARARVLRADIRPARPGQHRDGRRGRRTQTSTRRGPGRRRARAPRRQQPGQQPQFGDCHQATERLPPMRRHDDRAPPGWCRDRLCQVSSVTGPAAPAADPPAAPGRAAIAPSRPSPGCGRFERRPEKPHAGSPRIGVIRAPPVGRLPWLSAAPIRQAWRHAGAASLRPSRSVMTGRETCAPGSAGRIRGFAGEAALPRTRAVPDRRVNSSRDARRWDDGGAPG
jgi:hypothetical protein